jgi:hypothetical protein
LLALADDPELRHWHLAQLMPATRGADARLGDGHLLALAKAGRCGADLTRLFDWLSPAQTLALVE